MRVALIACSQCNWLGLDGFTDEVLGERLSARLTGTVLSPTDPASFPAVLGSDDPLFNLRRGHNYDNTFDHGSMTVMAEMDTEQSVLAIAMTGLKMTVIARRIVVVSAAYSQWYDVITRYLRGSDTDFHEFLTRVCLMMENMGFRQMFSGLDRHVRNGVIIFKDGEY